jgi:hypothetical protein
MSVGDPGAHQSLMCRSNSDEERKKQRFWLYTQLSCAGSMELKLSTVRFRKVASMLSLVVHGWVPKLTVF